LTEKLPINNSVIGHDRVIVIAGNRAQYQNFLHEHKLSPRQYTFADRPEQIMGMRNALYTLVGQYWLNPVYDKRPELFEVYQMRKIEI